MKKIILVIMILMLSLTVGCHKKEEPESDPVVVDPIEPVNPVEPVEPVDPVTPEEEHLNMDELLDILSSYNHYESDKNLLICFYKEEGNWYYKTCDEKGKNIIICQINDMYYSEKTYYIMSYNIESYEGNSINISFEDKIIQHFHGQIDTENYYFTYSTKEMPLDKGMDLQQLIDTLSSYSIYEDEDGFFVQFYKTNNSDYYSEGIWNSGYSSYGNINDICYKGNDVYVFSVLFPEIAEGVDNEYVPEHLEDITVIIKDEKMENITVISNNIEREVQGIKYEQDDSVFTALCSYDSFISTENSDFMVSFYVEMGNCMYYEADEGKGEFRIAVVTDIIEEQNGCYQMYLTFDDNEAEQYDETYIIYYSLDNPASLSIQFNEKLVQFEAEVIIEE